ncbi:MAG: MarR family transcriptional regulator [Crocinitomicaceae bacterium]|nr:MarR family transcriptional regulator [Crocinitomicaceae bacterium]
MKLSEELKIKFKSPQHKVMVNIRHTSNWISNRQNHFISQFDLSIPQFNILRILRGDRGMISVNTVKERMIEKSPNTTRLMDKLIDKGLINRVRCETDRRIVHVEITEKGLVLLKQIDATFDDSQFKTNFLTDDEARTLSQLLDKVRENI